MKDHFHLCMTLIWPGFSLVPISEGRFNRKSEKAYWGTNKSLKNEVHLSYCIDGYNLLTIRIRVEFMHLHGTKFDILRL